LNHWLQLTRLQTSGLTMALLVITRWVAAGVDLFDTLVMLIAGLLIHVYGFTLNEWADRDHDRGHPHKDNPVTDERISPNVALSLSLATLSLSLALLLWWGWRWSWTTIPLINSYIMCTSYNLRSKKYPRLSPFLMAGWAFMLSCWIVSLSGFPAHAMWLPFAWGFMLLLTQFEGTLKDWDHDGITWNRDRFHDQMILVQLAFLASILHVSFDHHDPVRVVVFLVVALLGAPACAATLAAVQQTERIRSKMIRNMGIHNMIEYALILVVSSIWVHPIYLLLAFLVPLGIYAGFNQLTYGRASAPSV